MEAEKTTIESELKPASETSENQTSKKSIADWINTVYEKKISWIITVGLLIIIAVLNNLHGDIIDIISNTAGFIFLFLLAYLYFYLKPQVMILFSKYKIKDYGKVTTVKFFKKEFLYSLGAMVVLVAVIQVYNFTYERTNTTVKDGVVNYKIIGSTDAYDSNIAIATVNRLYSLAHKYPDSRSITIDIYVKGENLKDRYGNPKSEPIFVTTVEENDVKDVLKFKNSDAYVNWKADVVLNRIKNSTNNYFIKLK